MLEPCRGLAAMRGVGQTVFVHISGSSFHYFAQRVFRQSPTLVLLVYHVEASI